MKGCMAALVCLIAMAGNLSAQGRAGLPESSLLDQASVLQAEGTPAKRTPANGTPADETLATADRASAVAGLPVGSEMAGAVLDQGLIACQPFAMMYEPFSCQPATFLDRSQILTTTPIMTTPIYETPTHPLTEPLVGTSISPMTTSPSPLATLGYYPPPRIGIRARFAPPLFNRLRWRR